MDMDFIKDLENMNFKDANEKRVILDILESEKEVREGLSLEGDLQELAKKIK